MKRILGLGAAALMLTGCATEVEQTATLPAPAPAITTDAPEAVFTPRDIAPVIITEDLKEIHYDEGLNIDVQILKTAYDYEHNASVFYLLIKNHNTVPLPVDAIAVFFDGGAPVPEATIPLDLPLGPGAATNLEYGFNVDYSKVRESRLTIGNLVYEGDLRSF
ncbi:hypothetical protein [Corynebacterium sp. HS2168-gen11]|uniref:hypothetical protein n=1 Tax=Corynebacterium sp. HS2168-gen11 TaxID=2974027 RepID=UPI00216AE9CB|nr:hypothetical protein [Corynebacterium sp. HS2168-gen11]MCS4535382.1 hypothetical protein [Corynebacterium sp. HS2168-gen11]